MRVIPDGEALRRRREACDLSMDALAELSTIRKQTIWRIETGKVNRSYQHTMSALARALRCELNELLRVVKQAAPPSEERAPDEADLSPEDFEELPDPSTLPPEPLRPDTMDHLSLEYRAHEGKRFTYATRVDEFRFLGVQERVAIKCIPAGIALCFETHLLTDTTTTRVPVYSNQLDLTRTLRDAIESGWTMRLVVKVLVVEDNSEFGTLTDGTYLPPDAFMPWPGFTWPLAGPRQMWCLVAVEATRADIDTTLPGGGYGGFREE